MCLTRGSIRMNKFRKLRSFDWVFTATTFLLVSIGIVAVYSVDVAQGGESIFGKKQLIALALGTVFFIAASFLAHTLYRATATWWYVLALILLAAVLFFGVTIRGTRGWFQVAGFSFQPVEFVKVALVLVSRSSHRASGEILKARRFCLAVRS